MSKVTQEELEKLQTQQNEITSLEAFIGKIELAKLENLLKLQQLKSEQNEYHVEIEGKYGKINITNVKYRDDFSPVDEGCACYTCKNYTRAYLAHLFRGKEMLSGTLATIHNLYFIVNLVKNIREAILAGEFKEFKTKFLGGYRKAGE